MNKILTIFILIFLIFFSSISIFSQNNLNAILGFPDSLGFIIQRPQYVLSYSDKLNSARWVSWFIDKNCFGGVKRYDGNFITDTILPKNFAIIKHSDYAKSGFDKGHWVKSEERTATIEDNKSTFYLTNIVPQKAELNQRIWLQLENYCEQLCKKEGKNLYVIAGGKYKKRPKKIAKKIAIPDSCWKVILVLDSGKTIENIDSNTQIIAVMMPTKSRISKKKKWNNFLTTARKIELSTGFNFYSKVDLQIQNIIENKKFVIEK
jgi:endonuclease G